MKKKWMALILTGLLALSMCVPVLASEVEVDSAGNVFATGDMVTLPSDSVFGAFLAGNNVSIDGQEAKGSLAAAGQSVYASDVKIGESLYAAGNSVILKDTKVKGNVWTAGNTVTMSGKTEANGIYAAGSIVTFSGTTNGLYVGAGKLVIDGTVNGDAIIDADEVKITDNAVITGNLKVRSSKQPEISDQAKVTNYSFEETKPDEEDLEELEEAGKAATGIGIGAIIMKKLLSAIYWIIAMVAFGMLLCWLFGDHLSGAAAMIRERTLPMILSGVIGWMSIPFAALMLLCTWILAPTAGMLAMAYTLLLCAGLAFAGASLARLIFPRMNVFLSALIGIGILEIVRIIPVLGTLVGIAADMYLIGYVIQKLWIGRLRKNAVEAAPAEPVNVAEVVEGSVAADESVAEETVTEAESNDAEE